MLLDRKAKLAAIRPDPAAEIPRRRQVRIKRKRPIEEGRATIEIAGEPRERVSASRQRDRVILAEFLPDPKGIAIT